MTRCCRYPHRLPHDRQLQQAQSARTRRAHVCSCKAYSHPLDRIYSRGHSRASTPPESLCHLSMCASEDAPGRVSQPRVVGCRADAVEPLTACRTPGSSKLQQAQSAVQHGALDSLTAVSSELTHLMVCVGCLLQTDPQERAKTTTASSDCTVTAEAVQTSSHSPGPRCVTRQ